MLEDDFKEYIKKNYPPYKESILLGRPFFKHQIDIEGTISPPLSMANRHGLISGATGTGKTKTLQILAEEFSKNGVPCLLMDIKGDLSGIAKEADKKNPKLLKRQKDLQLPWQVRGFPVEFLSISAEKGIPITLSLEKFGPLLLSRILDLNTTQEGVLSILFTYCKERDIRIFYLKDLYKTIQYLLDNTSAREAFVKEYGAVSTSSLSTLLRKIFLLRQEGGDKLFEKDFPLENFLSIKEGFGVIHLLCLADIQNNPRVFSTFMIGLLNSMQEHFKEVGDLNKPKFALFIDEAHFIFKDASKILLDKLETTIKLIRSKGIGIYFCTQLPGDIPDGILAQLGLKVQHALRGVTAKDRKEIKKAIENYPTSPFYKSDELIGQLAIGEALITSLNEKGAPSSLIHTLLRTPYSQMDVLKEEEINLLIEESSLRKKIKNQISRDPKKEFKLDEGILEEKQKPIEKKQSYYLEDLLKSPFIKNFLNVLSREGAKLLLGWIKNNKRKK